MYIHLNTSKSKLDLFALAKSLFIATLLISLSSCGGDDSPTEFSGAGDFITQSGTAQISGTLFLPEGDGPFPVVVIVPGSGNEPKEDSYGFNNIFIPEGYGVYHYDKRAIGGSTGAYPQESLENPINFLNARRDDVLGIVNLLSNHTDVGKIGLMGASQGAWVNVLVYDQNKEVDFMVMSVGGAAPTRIEYLYDTLLQNNPNMTIQEAMNHVNAYDGDLGYNPIPSIELMPLPVAWIFGGQDRSHPTYYDIPVLEEMDKSNFSIFLFENSNHELEDVTTGQFDPQLFPIMLNWLSQNVN